MTDAELIKKEDIDTIDKNGQIEVQEMEEFLKSEDNIKKLGETMESNTSPELLQEFESALKDLCENLLKSDELTDNQEQVLNYFLNKFGDKYPEIKEQLGGLCEKIIKKQNVNDISLNQFKTLSYYLGHCETENKDEKVYKKVGIFTKKLHDNYQKEQKNYLNGKGEKPNGAIAQFFEEIQEEQINKINQLAEERMKELEGTTSLMLQQKREKERLDKLLNRRENDKQEIEGILQKDGELSNEDKQKLLYFRDFYYKEGHILYRNSGTNPQIMDKLTNELGGEGLTYGIVGYDKIANDIDKKLNAGIFNSIDNIISKGELPKDIAGLQKINEWNNNFGNNNQEEYEKIKGMLLNEIKNIINLTFKNEDNDKLTQHQIGIIQLRTNIKYGENLEVDGNRGKQPFGNNKNQEITNLYIYRLEISTRDSKKYTNILKIKNLDQILMTLRSKDKEHKIFKDFITFFLKIKKPGKYFENQIGNESLEKVFQFLVDAEKYKNVTIDTYLDLYFSGDLTDEEKSQKEKLKQELQQYQTIGGYFENKAKELINLCLEKSGNLIEINDELILQNKIKEFYKLFGEISGDQTKKEKFENLGREIINNPKLQEKQRKEIIIMLGGAFSEIQTEWNTINIRQISTRSYTRGLGGDAPKSIKHTPGCKIKIEYDDPATRIGPGPTGRPAIQTKIFLDEKELSPFDILDLGPNKNKKREGYDIHIDENKDLIIKKIGDGSELKSTFGDKIYNEYQTEQQELNDKANKYEKVLDISTQVEAEEGMKVGPLPEKRKETVNKETGYTDKYNKYLRDLDANRNINHSSGSSSLYRADYGTYEEPKPPQEPNYTEYHELKIPGCEGKLVHSTPPEWNKIKEAIRKSGNNMCFNPTKKQTGEIYELTLKDLNIYEKDDKGDIHLYEINSNLTKGKEIKSISAENINEAKNTNSLIMTSIQMAPGLENALENAKNLSNDIKYIGELYKKFDRSNPESINEDGSRGLTDKDVKNIREKAVKIAENLNELCKHHNDLVQLKKGLEERYSGETNTNTEDEQRIKDYINNIDFLVNATIKGGEIYQYCESMLDTKNVHSNDEWLERVGWRFRNNGIKTLLAIAGGVAAVCLVTVTGGGSLALLKMAAMMTLGGMGGGFVGQVINEQINDYFAGEIEVKTENGTKKVKLRYNDPTSLELAIRGDISRKDFAVETGVQFILGTATTFGCMYAGQLVGGWITKACESGDISPKFGAFLRRFNKNFKVDNGDPMTDGLFKEIANKIGQNPTSLIKNFNAQFFKEFKEEIGEEFYETGFEEAANAFKGKNGNTGLAILLSGLSTLATAWHCITPGGNMTKIYTENGISIGNIDCPIGKNTLEITLDYSGDYNAIVEYYHKNGFELVDGHIEMKNPDNPKLTNIIHLRETSVPIAKRSLAAQLSGYGISLDSQTGKGYYENMTKIQELELSGKANVSIDPKTKKVTIISGETTLELEQDYFGGRSHKFDVNTTQAMSNSRMMDKLSNEINEGNQSEKLQELREEIQKQHKQATGQEIQLTDEQLLSIIKAHKEAGVIGNVDPAELRQKNTILSETIEDDGTRRFLLEAGFCAKSSLDLRDPLSNLQKKQIENRIRGNEENDKSLEEIRDEINLAEQELNQAKQELEEIRAELGENSNKKRLQEAEEKVKKAEKKLEILKENPAITEAKNALNNAIENIKQDIGKVEEELEKARKEGDEGKIKKLEKELNTLKNQEIMMKAILTKIENAREGLQCLIEGKPIGELKDGTVVYAETIEQFQELHQLGMNEGKTTIKDENGNETDLKRKKLDEKLRMLAVKYYYEAIMKPLGLKNFADPSLTMTDVNEQFVDETHSDGFEIKESDKLNVEKGKAENVGEGILDQIAINEGRIENGSRETENMSIEQKQDYYDRMIKEKIRTELGENTTEAKIATELRESAKKHSKGKISPEDQAYLFAMSMKQMADYKTAYPDRNAEQVFTLLNSNQNKLLHQHLWDLNTITSSDHGIKHVLRGNATLAENMFLQLEEKGEDGKTMRDKLYDNNIEKIGQEIQQAEKELEQAKKEGDTEKIKKVEKELERLKNIEGETPEQFKARWRVLTRQAIIDHDLGYTNIINKAFDEAGFSKGYITVGDHPLNSTTRIDNNQTFYTILFGEDGYNSLIESVPGHGNAQTQNIPKIADGTASQTEFIRGILSCVDCAGSPADYKIAHMFAQKGMIGGLFNAYNILNDKSIDPTTKQSLVSQALTNLVETIDAMPDSGELALIKESWKKGIDAFLTNKNYQNMSPDEMKDVLGFHFKKFLGAFGVRTEINPNTGKVKANINKNGGFSIEFALAGESFEMLSEMFGAGVSLKSLIGVCDDYKINDKGPTSKFVERQTQQAINQRKEDKADGWKNNGGKEKPLREYITEFFNHPPTSEEIAKFNASMKGNISFDEKNGKFYSDGKADDSSIDFSPDRGIIIKGPNNVEITLNFDGDGYEGFSETAGRFIEMNQMIDGHKDAILKAEENLRKAKESGNTKEIENAKNILGQSISEASQELNTLGQQYSKQEEGQRISTEQRDPITKELANLVGQNPENININEFISQMESLRTKYNLIMQTVQSSNPTLNN